MTTTILRHPAVAGRFYPSDPDDLRAEAQAYLHKTMPRSILPCVP